MTVHPKKKIIIIKKKRVHVMHKTKEREREREKKINLPGCIAGMRESEITGSEAVKCP